MARGLGVDEIIEMSLWATGGLVPDITFLLSLDEGKVNKRLSGVSRDRIEMEEDDFKRKVCQGYRKLAERFPDRIVDIDAGLTIEEISVVVREKVDKELEER
jgi:dTMP kinase